MTSPLTRLIYGDVISYLLILQIDYPNRWCGGLNVDLKGVTRKEIKQTRLTQIPKKKKEKERKKRR